MSNYFCASILCFYLSPLKTCSNISINVVDISYRINSNELFFNFYSIFWTNTWYLLLLLLLLIYFLINTWRYFNSYLIISVWLLLINYFIFELSSFHYSNTYFKFLNNYTWLNNFLLLNILNKYHPFIFYINVSFLFWIYLTTIFNLKKTQYVETISIVNLYKLGAIMFYLANLTLFLGSWWAIQEGSWGGWWNWDPSENFGLLLLFNIVILIHFFVKITNLFSIKLLSILFCYIYALIYSFLQINYSYTSHNFGLKFSYFFNNNWFFVEILLLLNIYFLINIAYNCYNFYKIYFLLNYNNSIHYSYLKKKTILFLLVPSLVIFVIGFKSLLNFFYWSLLPSNSFNISIEFEQLARTLVIIFLVYFLKINFSILLFIIISIFISNILFFFIKFQYFFNLVNTLHFGSYLLYFSNEYATIFNTNYVYELNNDLVALFCFKLNFKYIECDLYYVYNYFNNTGYNTYLVDLFSEYLLQNNNFLKIFHNDTLQFTKTVYSTNTYSSKLFNFYNEIGSENFLNLFLLLIVNSYVAFNRLNKFQIKIWKI